MNDFIENWSFGWEWDEHVGKHLYVFLRFANSTGDTWEGHFLLVLYETEDRNREWRLFSQKVRYSSVHKTYEHETEPLKWDILPDVHITICDKSQRFEVFRWERKKRLVDERLPI